MTKAEPLPGGKKIVRNINESVGIHENLVLKKLSENDPVLRNLLVRDKQLQVRIREREQKINQAFQVMEDRIKKTLRET